MTRLAALSDVHGNLLALEAILADIVTQGTPDAIWVLGDLAAFCPWPVETLARLREIPNVAFLQGNTDRYLVTGRRPAAAVHSPEAWGAMATKLAERDANFRWTVERLSYADYEFLCDLPMRLEMDIPGYGMVMAVHANAENDETPLLPDTPDERMRTYFSSLGSRLVLYGHTHRPVDRRVNGMRIVNDGSVGLSLDGDPDSAYALLDFEDGDCDVAIRRVAYDRDAVIAELERVAHPARRWVGGILRNASV
jgi:predicted phosphodiesterase